jgi:integrase
VAGGVQLRNVGLGDARILHERARRPPRSTRLRLRQWRRWLKSCETPWLPFRFSGSPPSVRNEAGQPYTTESRRRKRPWIFHGRGDDDASNLQATIALLNADVDAPLIIELLRDVTHDLRRPWADVELADLDDATITFTHQVDRSGTRVRLKTDDSEGTVVIPRRVAVMLLEHRARSPHCRDDDLVFATRSGRAISQRNALRALRQTQKRARTPDGKPTFPILHEDGPVPHGAVPTFHGFRHTAASYAIAAGDSAEEVSWMPRHKNSAVTRQVYVQEVKSAECRAAARSKLDERYGSALPTKELALGTEEAGEGAVVISLRS